MPMGEHEYEEVRRNEQCLKEESRGDRIHMQTGIVNREGKKMD